MITLSERAAGQIQSMRAEAPDSGTCLRLFVETGGCSGSQYGMSFDEAKPGDARFESEGVSIVLDAASLAKLDGTQIDFDDGLQGRGFEIRNPNAKNTCGCGKSFN
ncbi:iron-sulfur cluster assembly accessory protein [Termitidicoccus mucosus]|uniref:Heme biosynthesis protein HemY n=1 Tax=Termitidicoccus mucosus TaxID=1184151 RepID=A0A178IE54_9BACT|nr:heme biosynthesis protein HemY [Opitutaceae bacterium TSB47]